ncbi:hypothetical protein PGB90_001515 [Kerria lacca]
MSPKNLVMSSIVQYILVRGDLLKNLNWSLGAVVAQACHACVAVIHQYYTDECTQQYVQDIDNMHKVVLEIPNEEEFKKIQDLLIEKNIYHKVWIEQPENISTCIAIKPYPKNNVQKYFKKYKLLSC